MPWTIAAQRTSRTNHSFNRVTKLGGGGFFLAWEYRLSTDVRINAGKSRSIGLSPLLFHSHMKSIAL